MQLNLNIFSFTRPRERLPLLRLLFFWIGIIGLLGEPLAAEPLNVDVQAEAAIVINADTGAVLYEKNSGQVLYPASLTKIATAIYTLEKGGASLDSLATADQECVGFVTETAKKRSNYSLPSHYMEFGATHMVIHKGEKLSLRDLLYGMMVHSADDASNVIALHVGGTIPRFMTGLNAYLKEIGCKDTFFNNPHGLHHPQHQTTAYDLALLSAHALKNRQFREIVATTQWTRPKTEHQAAIALVQTNRLLRKGDYYYPKAIGIKTGFTAAAQHTLCAAAQHEGRTLVVVLLKTKERKDMFKDATKLFEAAFSQPKLERVLLNAGPLPYSAKVNGSSRTVQAALAEPLAVQYYAAEEPQLAASLQWESISLPVTGGQSIGQITVSTPEGRVIRSVSLLAAHDLRSSTLHSFFDYVSQMGLLGWIAVATAVLLLAYGCFSALRTK